MSDLAVSEPLSGQLGSGPVGFETFVLISAPLKRVWETVTQPDPLRGHFGMIPERPLTEPGVTRVDWIGYGSCLIEIKEHVSNERLAFEWNAEKQPYRTTVTFEVREEEGKVRLTVREKGWELTEAGVASAMLNCEGWSQFGVRVQDYVEHGITRYE